MREVLTRIDEAQLEACFEALIDASEEGRTVFLVGNGGSAATAAHMACDLAKGAAPPGRRPLRTHALTDNVALLTAFANDADYSRAYANQLRIHAQAGDVLIAISCSGESPNIVAALEDGRSLGLKLIGFGGTSGGKMRNLCDVYVHVPSFDYGMIESIHLVFEHCLTTLLEERANDNPRAGVAVLLDRDGVLVRNRDDYVKSWAEVEFVPGALEAIAKLSRAGHPVLVVTNQSAVGRGIMSAEDLNRIHERMLATVEAHAGRIEAFLVCPHAPDDNCSCRKPQPGLLHRARDLFGVDLHRAYLVGDRDIDMKAAAAAGCTGILLANGGSAPGKSEVNVEDTVEDLGAAVDLILLRGGSPKA
jgi:histidinol-phosphate phosphatase family protein